MSEQSNPVLTKVLELANRFGLAPQSVCGLAFKDSRKLHQLQRRDQRDQEWLEKLDALAEKLERDRRDQQQTRKAMDGLR